MHSQRTIFLLALAFVLVLSPTSSAQTVDNVLAVDTAWARLLTLVAPRSPGSAPDLPTDWTAIAAEAAKFRQDFPDSSEARSAARIELTARVRIEEQAVVLSPGITTAVGVYLRDTSNQPRDRLQLKIVFDQANLRRTRYESYEAGLEAQAGHARELMSDFPDQPDGYGYLLSLARLAPPTLASGLAGQLLANKNTPARFVAMALRIADRPALLGQPLRLDGAEAAIRTAAGKTLVVYSWRMEDEGFRSILKQMSSLADVVFIGINLDEDLAAARKAADGLPGKQFYDGGGLDGPKATQLKLVLPTMVYLVDGQGIVRDVDAHRAPYGALTRFIASKRSAQ